MDMNINALRQQSASLTERLQKQFKDQMSGGRQEDTRFWKPPQDKAGNGYAVIRFLPPPMDPTSSTGMEDSTYVKILSYGFQGPGGWYIENSPRTIGQDDPLTELNSQAYATKNERLIEEAKKRKMRTNFISNIVVIEDPANPENNGKVFLFRYGKKIFEMINDKLFPQFPGDVKMDAFNLWEGANFKLKVMKKDNFPNYDKSEFDSPAPLFGGDEAKLEAVWKQAHSLKAFLDPSNFKSYDDLKKRLDKALGVAPASGGRSSYSAPTNQSRATDDEPPFETEPTPQVTRAPAPTETVSAADDDDEMAFFKKIAAGK
jgi:hypothetical protein